MIVSCFAAIQVKRKKVDNQHVESATQGNEAAQELQINPSESKNEVDGEQVSKDNKNEPNIADLAVSPVICEEGDSKEAQEPHNVESLAKITPSKRKLQIQGKWRGVDPVVFFNDEVVINSIKEFYGISEQFPFDGHLVTRNSDTSHVKRIYYISKSVKNVLQLNFSVGQQLKVTSVGLKIFVSITFSRLTFVALLLIIILLIARLLSLNESSVVETIVIFTGRGG